MWDWPMLGAAAVLGVAAGGVLLIRNVPTVIMGLSLMRYAVFALQYLLFLTAFGAISWAPMVGGRMSSHRSGVVRRRHLALARRAGREEAAAAWAFDDHLPAVVAATFGLWLLNRGGSAPVGALVVGQMWHSPQSPCGHCCAWCLVSLGHVGGAHAITLWRLGAQLGRCATTLDDAEPDSSPTRG